MKKRTFKFKIGDKVKYQIIEGSVMFTGVIGELVTNKKEKPYVIFADDNSVKYANEQYLTLIKENV